MQFISVRVNTVQFLSVPVWTEPHNSSYHYRLIVASVCRKALVAVYIHMRNHLNCCCSVLVYSISPSLRLTTSKAIVIVWRLRGNIIRTDLYIANVLSLQWAQLTKKFIHPGWPW